MTTHASQGIVSRIPSILPWGRRGTAGASIPQQIEFQDVSVEIQGRVILQNISFKINAGEIIALVGPSGCGKSTLLRVIAGLEHIKSGRILLDGREIANHSNNLTPEKRSVGLMFQDYALFPHMTVEQNIGYGLKRYEADMRQNAITRSIARVGLDDKRSVMPEHLSGGEQQRVALARTIAPRPSLLLLDEPFSNLDRHLRDQVRDETLAVLREIRSTTLVVTHDAEEAMHLADRIFTMRHGRIIQMGTPEEIFCMPCDLEIAQAFSAVNVLPAHRVGLEYSTPLGCFSENDLKIKAQNIQIAVRPHCIHLTDSNTGVKGRIMSRHYLGEFWRLDVGIEAHDTPLIVRIKDRTPPHKGQEVGVVVHPCDLIVFVNDQKNEIAENV